jgi:hypothetical protein
MPIGITREIPIPMLMPFAGKGNGPSGIAGPAAKPVSSNYDPASVTS